MFGGEIIDVSGPCIRTNNLNDIKCQFGQKSSNSPIRISTTKVRCVVPHLSERGRIKLSLSVDRGRSYPFETHFTIGKIAKVNSYVNDENGMSYVYK